MIDLEDLARLGGADAHEGAAPGEEGHLAGELAGPVHDHDLFRSPRGTDDLETAADHDEEGRVLAVGVEEDLARHHLPPASVGFHAAELFRGEGRKHVLDRCAHRVGSGGGGEARPARLGHDDYPWTCASCAGQA